MVLSRDFKPVYFVILKISIYKYYKYVLSMRLVLALRSAYMEGHQNHPAGFSADAAFSAVVAVAEMLAAVAILAPFVAF